MTPEEEPSIMNAKVLFIVYETLSRLERHKGIVFCTYCFCILVQENYKYIYIYIYIYAIKYFLRMSNFLSLISLRILSGRVGW